MVKNSFIIDASFWSKLIQDSQSQSHKENTSQYVTALADRFSSLDEFYEANENDLINLGIDDSSIRLAILKNVRRFEQIASPKRRSSLSMDTSEVWLSAKQSTPLNPKAICNLSLASYSRISFNEQFNESLDLLNSETLNFALKTPERSKGGENNVEKRTPMSSTHGLRPVKSISDSVSLQKKILTGSERLKRLSLTKTFLKRHGNFFRKQVNNLKKKIINPLWKSKMNNENCSTPRAEKLISHPQLRKEDRTPLQILNFNQQVPMKDSALSMTSVNGGRFKIGAPTTFVTRSLANRYQNL